MHERLILISFALLIGVLPSTALQPVGPGGPADIVVDNFDDNAVGEFPSRWRFLNSRTKRYEALEGYMADDEQFVVTREGGRVFLRAYTQGEAQRISMPNGEGYFDWDLRDHPNLEWSWRALSLPEGADERDRNDTGGAVYVTFKTDWLGRPQSIKYTYSSTLPVGTVVSFGRLKVIVASSGVDPVGDWVDVRRNVFQDYVRVFDRDPPTEPLSITLWSDSDDTGGEAIVDFDDIRLVTPARSRD